MARFISLFFSILLSGTLSSQGLQGIRTERWAGMSAIHLNPALSNTYPGKWQIQVAGAQLYSGTNYVYFKNTRFSQLVSRPEDVRAVSDTLGNVPLPQQPIYFDFPIDRRKWYGVLDSRVDGPALGFWFGQRHAVGVFSALRILTCGYQIPRSLGYTYLDAVRWGDTHASGHFAINGMIWGELGLHYNYRSPKEDGNFWGFGVNLKHLAVYQAGYARTNQAFKFIRENRDSMTLVSGDWNIAFTNDLANDLDNIEVSKPSVNGRGFSLDVGFNYLVSDPEADQPEDYLMQLGASITDLGFARVTRNAERHQISFSDSVTISLRNLNDVRSADDVIKKLSFYYLNDSTSSRVGERFSLLTPARINLHADYRIRTHVYVSASWQQRIVLTRDNLKAPNLFAITPRLETRWLSAFVPVTLVDYRQMQVGLALRLGPLTIGTDQLFSHLGEARWKSTDMYALVKIDAFKIRKRDRALTKKDRTWRKVGCYEF